MTGSGREPVATPRSSIVATPPQPSAQGMADATTTATTKLMAPTARASDEDDERDREEADAERRQIEFSRAQERADGTRNVIGSVGGIAGQIGQLAEHDVDADRVDEADHDRVGDEAHDRTEAQQAHHRRGFIAGDHREREEGHCGIEGGGDLGVPR